MEGFKRKCNSCFSWVAQEDVYKPTTAMPPTITQTHTDGRKTDFQVCEPVCAEGGA